MHKTRGNYPMKSILLTSTALVMVAGAAAAEVTFSGSAEAKFNDNGGVATFTTDVDATLNLSQDLDNGMTVSASFDVVDGNGSVFSLKGDNVSLTFGTNNADLNGAAYDAVGDEMSATLGAGEEGLDDGVSASFNLGTATVLVSAADPFDADDIELGLKANAGGFDLGLGLAGDDFVATAAGNAGGLDVTLRVGTLGGSNEWNAEVSYPLGAVTVGASLDSNDTWEITADYAADGVSAGVSFDSNDDYELTAGYSMGDVSVSGGINQDSDFKVVVMYTIMEGLTAEAGMTYAEEVYARVDYDLGGGASLTVSQADAADIDDAEDMAAGTTVALSFSF
jgi:hypothetical protein